MIDKHNDLEKTQEMAVVSDETQILPPELRKTGKIYGERVVASDEQFVAPKKRRSKAAVLVGAFFAAAIIGYLAFSYMHDSNELTENDRLAKAKNVASQEAHEDKQSGLSLADIKRTTKDYAIAVNDKKIELQEKQAELADTLNKAQESLDDVKTIVDKAGNLKKQADDVLTENEGVFAAVKKFVLEQQQRFQELFGQDNNKKVP